MLAGVAHSSLCRPSVASERRRDFNPQIWALPGAPYDPVLFPPGIAALWRHQGRYSRAKRASLNYPVHPSDMPNTRMGCFPVHSGLPRFSCGSASITSLSRCLWGSGEGWPRTACRNAQQAARQIPGPLMNPAVGAHVKSTIGAVAIGPETDPRLPVAAHQNGRAAFRYPAFRLASPRSYRRRANMNVA